MKRNIKTKISALLLIVALCLSVCAFTACGDADDNEGYVKVKSLKDITSYPYTDYLPGEVFDITGLAIKVNLENGRTRKYFDSDFTEWTHKDEPLTEDITKITVKIPNDDFTFDLDIFVGIPADSRLIVDSGPIAGNRYYAGVPSDFSALKVKYYANGYANDVSANDWRLFDGESEVDDVSCVVMTEGEHTFTVKYLSDYTGSFNVTALSADQAIYPRRIEAEDCCYETSILHTNNAETGCTSRADDNCPQRDDSNSDKQNTSASSTSSPQYCDEYGAMQSGMAIARGASGRGVVNMLAPSQNGRLRYFKLKVNVATEDYYDVFLSAQPMGNQQLLAGKFAVNVNDGGYVPCETSGYVLGGSRVADYVAPGTKPDGTPVVYTGWLNDFWFGEAKLTTVKLKAGDNTINIRMPYSGYNADIDYFEIRRADEEPTVEPELWSMREVTSGGVRVKSDITDGTLYLEYGSTLTDIAHTPEGHPFKYTLLYLHLPDGNVLPVGEHMLSGIDYEKAGEQNVTVVCKKRDGTLQAITTFKLFIYQTAD